MRCFTESFLKQGTLQTNSISLILSGLIIGRAFAIENNSYT